MSNFTSDQEVDRLLAIHASTQFDVQKLSSNTRRLLKGAGITISAAGTMAGVTAADVDRLFERLNLPISNRIAIKLELRSNKILMPFNVGGV